MAQALHYANVKHTTCQTAKGQRRSPVAGVSYDSDMELLDMVTGRKLYRPHHDGTEVIYSEIFSDDPDCPYADKSEDLQERRQNLWNDLYKENKSNKERHRCYGEVAIPNNITDEEMKELAKRLGNYFCTTFKRPVDISVHKKPGNNHIHFSLPEREYRKGKWMQKRKKYYKDMDGNLIKDKIYKDEKGWDIRKPKLDKKKLPKSADDKEKYRRDPITGDYVYQKLGERNKKQWEEDTREGKFLEKEELSDMHNGIDNVVNTFLHEQGYDITVRRNRPEVTKIMKELGIKQIRIATTDYKMNTSAVEEVRQKNERNRNLQRAIEDTIDKAEQAEIDVLVAQDNEMKAEALADLYTEDRQAEERKFEAAEKEYQEAVKNYVENGLHPEEVFISDYMQPYQEALNFKEKQCAAAVTVLTTGINKTDSLITELDKKEERTDREENKLQFLQENKASFVAVSDEVARIRKQDKSAEMRQLYRNRWNGLTGWQRAAYIYKKISADAGIIYRDYMIAKGVINLDQKETPDFSVPKKNTYEKVLANVINGKGVPGIKSKFDAGLSAAQNAENATGETLERWTDNINQEIPLPPSASDFEFLTLAATVPERVGDMDQGKTTFPIHRAQVKDYQPEKSKENYLTRETEITKAEEQAQKEAERLAAEAKQKAIKQYQDWKITADDLTEQLQILIAESADTYMQNAVQHKTNKAMLPWEQYQEAKKFVDGLETKYDNIVEQEEEKRSNSPWYNKYEINQYKIDQALNDYVRAKNEFDNRYFYKPDEPDKEKIWKEEWKKTEESFNNMSAKDIIAAYNKQGIDTAQIEAAYKKLVNHLKNMPTNPDDPNAGQNAQRLLSRITGKTSREAKEANRPKLIFPKGREGRNDDRSDDYSRH